ncbi:Gfo/Idh/MocA family protein [Flavitalea sp.]|nr:Gfo/Idh/MocA family oxidoreductase [Flavitalea sp.]
MTKWKFGIIGSGMIADFHAKAISSLANATIAGVYGTNAEKTRALANKYRCPQFLTSAELLSSPDIDIVTIATPSGAHLAPAIEAARNGKHVLCEKPIEITLERIDKMIAAHAEAGTYLGGIFNYRYHDSVRHLKRAVDSGRFGTITHASIQVPWWRNEDYYKGSWHGTWKLDGGGALMNQAVHMVDLLQYLMGPVESLHAYIATLGHDIEVEDTATATLRFKNNALGNIYGSTASFPGQFRRLFITGTKGTVTMLDNSFENWQFAEEQEDDAAIRKQFANVEGGGGASDPKAIPFEPHARNIGAFIEAIEQGRTFEIDGTEARKAIEIVEAIYKSAKENKHVNIVNSR